MDSESIRVRPFGSLTSKFAINWRVHLAFAVPAISSGLFNDYGRLGGDLTSWILITAFGYLITVSSIEILMQGQDALGIKKSVFASLLILVLAGSARGGSIYLLGTLLGAVPETDFVYRILGAPIYVVSTYIIFNTVVTAFLEQREAEQGLRKEQQTLAQSRALFAEEIQRLRLERKAKVQQAISPSLWEISKLLTDAKIKGDTSNLVAAIRSANENVVRPLSHSLNNKFELPTLSAMPALARVGRMALPRRVKLGSSFSVFMLVAFSLAMGYSTQALSFGLLQALTNVLVAGSYFAVLTYLLKFATANLEHSTWVGLFSSIALGFGVGYSSIWLIDVQTLAFDSRFPLQAAIFFSLSYPSVYLLAAAQAQRKVTLLELEKVVAALRVLNSQLRQQVWLDQKLLATELHGSVQATLHATALSLAKNKKPSIEDLDKVMESVQRVVDRLGDAAYLEGSNLKSILDDIALVWEDSCEIRIDLSQEAQEILDHDPRAARSVVEVVRETVTNAIKHNSAAEIDVLIDLSGNLIEVVISNPGKLDVAKQVGLGNEIMRELTLEHRLDQVGPLVMLRALIPQSLAVEA